MKRVAYLDSVKAFGMFLIFYLHYAEMFYPDESGIAMSHRKLICAMIIQLFLFLSGIFWKPNQKSIFNDAGNKIFTRIIPFLFFSITAIPLWLMAPNMSVDELLKKALYCLAGSPGLNLMTWFLVCLFTAEIYMIFFSKVFKPFNTKIVLLYSAMFSVAGYFVTEYGNAISKFSGIPVNFWYLNEAVVAASFYLSGYALRNALLKPVQLRKDIIILLVSGLAFLLTWDLNRGPFKFVDGVLMSCSIHGNMFLFYFTSYAGIFFVIYFFRIFPMAGRISEFYGGTTLIYMGLNGFCFHFINRRLIMYLDFRPDTGVMVFLYCAVYSVVLMLAFMPIAFVLRKYLPELVGSKWSETSIIPRMRPLLEFRWLKRISNNVEAEDLSSTKGRNM